jgi:hypothetical protein
MARHNAPDRRSHLPSETRHDLTATRFASDLAAQVRKVGMTRAEAESRLGLGPLEPLESAGERGTADDA